MHVKDGKLTKVEGDPEGPLNHGYLCPIGAATTELVYSPHRLKFPQRRIGPRGSGKWERISWDEALDEISEKVLKIRAESGPESIAMGTGTGRHHIRWVSRFGNALGTPNWCEPGFAQCFHPRVNTCILESFWTSTAGDCPCAAWTRWNRSSIRRPLCSASRSAFPLPWETFTYSSMKFDACGLSVRRHPTRAML